MKKLSLIITLAWGAFPFIVKATESQNSVDWLWFSIIWFVMGIAVCCTTYLFSILDGMKEQKK